MADDSSLRAAPVVEPGGQGQHEVGDHQQDPDDPVRLRCYGKDQEAQPRRGKEQEGALVGLCPRTGGPECRAASVRGVPIRSSFRPGWFTCGRGRSAAYGPGRDRSLEPPGRSGLRAGGGAGRPGCRRAALVGAPGGGGSGRRRFGGAGGARAAGRRPSLLVGPAGRGGRRGRPPGRRGGRHGRPDGGWCVGVLVGCGRCWRRAGLVAVGGRRAARLGARRCRGLDGPGVAAGRPAGRGPLVRVVLSSVVGWCCRGLAACRSRSRRGRSGGASTWWWTRSGCCRSRTRPAPRPICRCWRCRPTARVARCRPARRTAWRRGRVA